MTTELAKRGADGAGAAGPGVPSGAFGGGGPPPIGEGGEPSVREERRSVPAGRGAAPEDGAAMREDDGAVHEGRPAHAEGAAAPGFLRRYRLPLLLGLVALCFYVGSILYILFGRGQLA